MHKRVNEAEVCETKKIGRCKSLPSVQSPVYFEDKQQKLKTVTEAVGDEASIESAEETSVEEMVSENESMIN